MEILISKNLGPEPEQRTHSPLVPPGGGDSNAAGLASEMLMTNREVNLPCPCHCF